MRTYDRNVPRPLPVRRMLGRTLTATPDVVDERPWCGNLKDQGQEGACTMHAGTSKKEWIDRKYFKTASTYSPQYGYAKELLLNGDFPHDEGSDGTTMCQVLITSGCCDLDLYPYVPGRIEVPTAAQDANAYQHRLGAYHGIPGSAVARCVLGDKTPWVVAVGFTVLESFESPEVASSGIYNPGVGEKSLGGHEVLCVGYDLGQTPSIRPANCPPAFLIQNSWGAGWGLSGFFWMVKDVFDAIDTDLKIAHSGHPW